MITPCSNQTSVAAILPFAQATTEPAASSLPAFRHLLLLCRRLRNSPTTVPITTPAPKARKKATLTAPCRCPRSPGSTACGAGRDVGPIWKGEIDV